MLRDYYMKYETIMSDLQINAYSQPLIESFEKGKLLSLIKYITTWSLLVCYGLSSKII